MKLKPFFRVILSFGILLLSLIIMAMFSIQNFKPAEPENLSNQSVTPSFNTRLRFEKNVGQTDSQVDFLCRGKNHILYLTPTESVLHLLGDEENLNSVPLRMQMVGANHSSEAIGIHQLKSRSNYFNGNDPGSWLTNIPHYSRIGYKGVYHGIDLVYYIRNNEVEFDFIVKPGVQPDVIHLRFAGADKTTLNRDGDLVVRAGNHELIYRKPVAWQTFENEKHHVDVRFTLANNSIGFDLGEYDTK